MTKKDLYKELARIQAKRKILEAQENELKIEILSDMEKAGETTKTNTYGKFTIGKRISFTYSKSVDALMEKIKLAKVIEEQKGIAKAKETKFIVFTANK